MTAHCDATNPAGIQSVRRSCVEIKSTAKPSTAQGRKLEFQVTRGHEDATWELSFPFDSTHETSVFPDGELETDRVIVLDTGAA